MPLFPIPRTRPARPAEIRGPCRKRSWGSAIADVQTLERRGRFETFPYRLRAESRAWRYCRPQDTSHGPSSRHRHHVPGTTTTYHVPTGRTRGSAPTLRREKCTTNHEPKLQATSYRPLAAVSSSQPNEPIGSREPVQTGAVSVALEASGKMMVMQSPKRDFLNGPGPGFRRGDDGCCS